MTGDLFPKPPRRRPRRLMHVYDAGSPEDKHLIACRCARCGHDTGWIEQTVTLTEAKRGIPCPICNSESAP